MGTGRRRPRRGFCRGLSEKSRGAPSPSSRASAAATPGARRLPGRKKGRRGRFPKPDPPCKAPVSKPPSPGSRPGAPARRRRALRLPLGPAPRERGVRPTAGPWTAAHAWLNSAPLRPRKAKRSPPRGVTWSVRSRIPVERGSALLGSLADQAQAVGAKVAGRRDVAVEGLARDSEFLAERADAGFWLAHGGLPQPQFGESPSMGKEAFAKRPRKSSTLVEIV